MATQSEKSSPKVPIGRKLRELSVELNKLIPLSLVGGLYGTWTRDHHRTKGSLRHMTESLIANIRSELIWDCCQVQKKSIADINPLFYDLDIIRFSMSRNLNGEDSLDWPNITLREACAEAAVRRLSELLLSHPDVAERHRKRSTQMNV